MKLKPRIVCAALLAVAATPAWALQLGQIEVKSALNQPLVAAIPLHPENLTELDGLTVSLASSSDFTQAGLQVTPTDQTLRFHVTTDNNGQKLILVTSTQPITDPYLDFLVQVSTRQGKQVREFVVLLNPVIAAPAPEVQTAPVAGAPAAPVQTPAELPPASAFPQPAPPAAQPEAKVARQPASKPAPAPAKPATPPPAPVAKPQAAASQAGGSIRVERGDSLYVIAKRETEGNRGVINQMMLALKSANPDAFFKDNINDLKTGAILRIPTRDEIDQTSVAAANAEVHRQYEAWRAARPQAATVVAGTAAEAAANAAPKPGKAGAASDHLALTPPTGAGGAAENRPGVAGGTGKETVAGLQQQLQNDRGALVSLEQSNADLESRSRSLKDIAAKSDKLLSLKDATVAELQHKLAEVQSGKAGAAGSASALASTGPATSRAVAAAAPPGAKPEHKSPAPAQAQEADWFSRPLTWIIAGLVVLALILISLLRKRRKPGAASVARGPLSDPADVAVPQSDESIYESSLRADLEENPGKLSTYLKLCRLYNSREDEPGFIEVAKAMREHVTDLHCAEWTEVAAMGEELAPHLPLFELPAVAPPDAFAGVALQLPFQRGETFDAAPAPASASEPEFAGNESHEVEPPAPAAAESEQPEADAAIALGGEPDFADDPVDTKLDLARAYLDMGDPVGARAMLEEVIEEGSQTQKDEAKRLLADVAG